MNNGLHEHIRVFVAIAQARSLTGASIATGINQATISRQLAALERHLGCALFRRSTRAISLTERGELFLRQAQQIIELVHEAEASVQESGAGLRGRLRVACSNGFGRKLLIPALPQWQLSHPEVHIELMLSDQLSPLVAEHVDVAIRLGPLEDSNLLARRIGTAPRVVVASPDYLDRHGAPLEPAHLQQHQCLLFAGKERPGHWQFNTAKSGASTSVHVDSRLTLSSVDAMYDAVLAGLGIAQMPAWFWTTELKDGRVRRLLEAYALPPQDIHAVTPVRPRAGGKISQFIGWVERLLPGNP